MKISTVAVLLSVSSANAFVPAAQRPFLSRAYMSEETETEVEVAEVKVAVAAPVPAASIPTPSPAGALVPIKQETVEFTAGILGGYAGFLLGGPLLGAIAAAAANYASKAEGEVADVIQAVSKSSIQVFNYLANLDGKYKVLDKAQGSLGSALEKLKSNPSVNPDTVKKVESALASTKSKISEINEEYDLVGGGVTALGVIGDLVEKSVVKANELDKDYNLSDKALASLKVAVEKAKVAAADASVKASKKMD
jgi:hypothetical protein